MNENNNFAQNMSLGKLILFVLPTIIALLFFHLYGSSYEAAYYGVWYSIVGSELLATIMTFIFFKVKRKKYQY